MDREEEKLAVRRNSDRKKKNNQELEEIHTERRITREQKKLKFKRKFLAVKSSATIL